MGIRIKCGHKGKQTAERQGPEAGILTVWSDSIRVSISYQKINLEAAQRKKVNKRVLKELLPIHCTEKKNLSQLPRFPFFTILLQSWGSECSQEVVLTRQLQLRKRGGGGLRGQDRRGAGTLGREDCTGEAKTFTPCHACSPPHFPLLNVEGSCQALGVCVGCSFAGGRKK